MPKKYPLTELEKNKLKEKASREIGFNYRLIIYDN